MAALITFCTSLAAIAGGVWAVPKLYRACSSLADGFSTFNHAVPILKEIAAEFARNGGKTLKDQIVRIEAKADQAIKMTTAQNEVLTAQNKVLSEIQTKVCSGTTCPVRHDPPASRI